MPAAATSSRLWLGAFLRVKGDKGREGRAAPPRAKRPAAFCCARGSLVSPRLVTKKKKNPGGTKARRGAQFDQHRGTWKGAGSAEHADQRWEKKRKVSFIYEQKRATCPRWALMVTTMIDGSERPHLTPKGLHGNVDVCYMCSTQQKHVYMLLFIIYSV